MKKPKIAFVYDRVNTPYGGAEQVLLALHQLYPQAPLFTAVYQPHQAPWAKVFPQVIPSWLNKIPFFNQLHRWIPFLMPLAFESFDFNGYDIIISITSAEAKGIITKPDQLHLCYLLTPPRYLYQDRAHSLNSHQIFKIAPIKWLAEKLLNYLTWWDQAAVLRPDIIIPISERVAQRVRQYYPTVKPAKVIYPPVDNSPKDIDQDFVIPKKFFLINSRLVSYKHLDQAIIAWKNLQEKLVIIGSGPEEKKLKNLVTTLNLTDRVFFYKNLHQSQLNQLYQHCQALIMPGEEDFGIVALEANSFAKPVLINSKSGAAECIDHTLHGVHITREKAEDILKALEKFKKLNFDKTRLLKNVTKYDTNTFTKNFAQVITTVWQKHRK